MTDKATSAVVQFMTPQQVQTINMLRTWLREAEEGELIEVAAVFVAKDRSLRTGASSSEDIARLAGGVELLRARILEAWRQP